MDSPREMSENYYRTIDNLFKQDSNYSILIPGLFNMFNGKRILITGAAGSVGSEISKQVTKFNPGAVGLLDINESGLADLSLEIEEFSTVMPQLFLTDISRSELLYNVFKEFKPDIIYHTAAYKHVPVIESFPEASMYVNIVGTYNLVELAGKSNAEKLIFISTDKAVNPTCVMGKSKKIAEEIIRRIRFYSDTDYITVRLGNIVGSRGSASEIFKRQIVLGYPVTLTDNKMKRFFMTLQDAVKLIFLATQTGQDGDLFIPDLQAVYVYDFITTLIGNLKPYNGHNIEIKIIGIRKGEKTDEELMTADELKSAKYYDGYYLVDTNNSFFNINELLDSFKIYDCSEFENIRRILKLENRLVRSEEVQY